MLMNVAVIQALHAQCLSAALQFTDTCKHSCAPQIKDAAKAYRVYFTKTDDSKDYLVDHSIIMYLIDPKGNFVSFYGKNYTAEQLATAVGSQIEKWSA